MENNVNNQNTSEEVDLFKLFNFFESKIKSVFRLFYNFIHLIYGFFIKTIKDVFSNLKITIPLVVGAIVLGVVIDTYKDQVYYSQMYVTPNFDAKYELIGSIGYYNSLISLGDYEELSSRFNLSMEEAKSLVDFEIEIGPESKNEQILKFNGFLKGVDSITRTKLTFEDFINERNLYTAEKYLITARAKEYNIFKKLSAGLNKSVNETYSSVKQKEKNMVLKLEEENLQASLIEIKKLKETYLKVIEKESEKTNLTSSLGSSLGLQVEKTETKEDKLLEKELEIKNKLSAIKKDRILNNKIFENYSEFKEKGLKESSWTKKFKIIIPILVITMLILGSVFFRFYKYVLNYKS
jgi:hypothetical protein